MKRRAAALAGPAVRRRGKAIAVNPAGTVILELPGLVPATVVGRPSARNRSPYVGDVRLADGRVAIAHMPSMEMGGKCVAGAECLLKPATDKAGRLVGSEATGKYGTPKCEFIMQLLRCVEP